LITLAGLRKEIDDTRFLLNEKNRGNADLQAEIAATREQIARREAEIFASSRDCQQKADTACALRTDIDNLSHELANLREEKSRDGQEIQRLRDLNAIKERENADGAQRIKSTDYALYQN